MIPEEADLRLIYPNRKGSETNKLKTYFIKTLSLKYVSLKFLIKFFEPIDNHRVYNSIDSRVYKNVPF